MYTTQNLIGTKAKFGRHSLDGKINTRKIKTKNDDRLLEEIDKILQDTRKKIQKSFK